MSAVDMLARHAAALQFLGLDGLGMLRERDPLVMKMEPTIVEELARLHEERDVRLARLIVGELAAAMKRGKRR